MLFNSHEFLLFFIVVILLYYSLPQKFIMPLLVLASAVFYCFFIPAYLLILLLVILVDYFSALGIEKHQKHRKLYLIGSIISNLGILFVFKYFNFFIENINTVTDSNYSLLNIILPIGLSFHTFQSLSYVLEVYNKKFSAEKNIGFFALYVLYFPQLVAGPIERPQNILPQFKMKHALDWNNILIGGRLVLWGLFKKVVIADRISYFVNSIHVAPLEATNFQCVIAILFFSIQIYCDFSGYSDMAIGLSKMLGIDLMINFNRPYFAKNIQEFWQKWHISLSTWFRDYIYFPLGGSKIGELITVRNIMIVFVLSGFWHGAGWNFIVWGMLHGLGICLYMLFKKFVKLPSNVFVDFLSLLITFLFVSICWTFFRANHFADALVILQKSFQCRSLQLDRVFSNIQNFSYGNSNVMFILICFIILFVVEKFSDVLLFSFHSKKIMDVIFCISILLLIVFTGVFTKQNFIYFQF